MPESGGDYDADIEDLQMQLDDILVDVYETLAAFEEKQEEQEKQADETATETDETTRWDLEAWTDHESFGSVEIALSNKKIEDEDDYTIYLGIWNRTGTLANAWDYEPVEIKEIVVDFMPNSGDRVIINKDHIDFYGEGYSPFDWDIEVKTRTDGTCKRIQVTTEDKYTLPAPADGTIDTDVDLVEFKLTFELAYKQ